jgi:hypothetical protein
MTERTQFIEERLRPHYEEMDIDVLVFTKEQWADVGSPDPTGNRRFGWIPPYEEGQEVLFPVCPEIIAEQTEDLDDLLFGAYVDVIQFTCDLSIAYHGIEDDYERARMIDKRLLDTAAGSMRLINRVQMRALDAALSK